MPTLTHSDVLRDVRTWPAEARRQLAADILQTVDDASAPDAAPAVPAKQRSLDELRRQLFQPGADPLSKEEFDRLMAARFGPIPPIDQLGGIAKSTRDPRVPHPDEDEDTRMLVDELVRKYL